ncbi:VOC family protein [Gryllotalpicola daejeonensis]|uniref:VOC family protein n=1 Tax=Gryllotalpicola daejeonensis TaxID=993087 RepID=A0ABP7ZN11_9MICO
MKFVSTRVVTADVARLADFYELVTGVAAIRPAPVFAELITATATFAIGDVSMVPVFAPGAAEAAANRSAIFEFLVDDVDAEYQRLSAAGVEIVTEPAVMPWGNRVFFLRDPDGNLVGLFKPETAEAVERFRDRPYAAS